MNTTENQPIAQLGLSLREQERERSACREWLGQNDGDKISAAEREIAEKAWIYRAEQQKKKPFLSEAEKASVLKRETADKIAFRLSHELGYPVPNDDPMITVALSSIVLHENLQTRDILLIERLIERMERYESNIQDAARLLSINTAISAKIKQGVDTSASRIAEYNSNAAKLADKQGQILRVDNSRSDNRILYTILIFGFIALVLLILK